MSQTKPLPLDSFFGTPGAVRASRLVGDSPEGRLPLTADMLLDEPSGNLFGLTQNAGMGWDPAEVNRPAYLILSTQGGLRDENGQPTALGYHTGHWELGLLVRAAAQTLRAAGALPFAGYVSDPCDGRTQGTAGMMDSLPYRNDAAIVLRRLIRSLPTRKGVLGIASCDKGLPAMMMALAGCANLPGLVVPGGVTLPGRDPVSGEIAEDAGKIQSIGSRFAHGLVSLEYAAEMGCKVCGSSGGGCQFLGTAATAQVVAEALGMALPHSALAPSGEPVWLELAERSSLALVHMQQSGLALKDLLTPASLENAMLVHAAFGGSTNLLLHIPAIAHAAGLPRPAVQDWIRANRAAPRLVDVLPNGPRGFATVQVFMAGGVPEVMLHLRRLGLLNLDVLTGLGQPLSDVLDAWEASPRRLAARQSLADSGVDPDLVILDPDSARREGLTRTLVFPVGNLAPHGSVIKATAIDPQVVDPDNVYRHSGRARVFTSEQAAIRAVKGLSPAPLQAHEILVLIGGGPLGTGMEETYQLTGALKHLPWGKTVPLLTDARFSGVSTGACVGHIGPEALAGGPVGRLRDGDWINIHIDREQLEGSINLVGITNASGERQSLEPTAAAALLRERSLHPDLQPRPDLPDDTRLWAALQAASGGTWAGSVYDVERIIEVLEAGLKALEGDA
jgi:xylonate dehydratase